jgi:hypothetical protein
MATTITRDIVVGSASAPITKSPEWASLREDLPKVLLRLSKVYTGLNRTITTESEQVAQMKTLALEILRIIETVESTETCRGNQ